MSAAVHPELRRERRIAAAQAARRQAPHYGEPQQITLAELRSDDFLVVVPSQQGVRGLRYECVVGVTGTTLDEWGYRTGPRRPLRPVEAVTITPLDPRLPTSSYPAAFTATVRRVQP